MISHSHTDVEAITRPQKPATLRLTFIPHKKTIMQPYAFWGELYDASDGESNSETDSLEQR